MEGKEYEFDFFNQFELDFNFALPYETTLHNLTDGYNLNLDDFFNLKDDFYSDPENHKNLMESDIVKLKLEKVDSIIHNNLISSPTSSKSYTYFRYMRRFKG
jgi:hypothetical protein